MPCVRRGPADGVPLLIVPALFEEMNRTRRLLALVGAALAVTGVRTWLPDLPGTGDHAGTADAMDVERWRAAIAAVAREAGRCRAPHLIAVRGGALLVDGAGAASLYRLAPPADGTRPLRDLWRARAAAEREAGGTATPATLEAGSVAGETIEAAGYAITARLAAQMRALPLPAPACPARTAATTAGAGVDVVLPGPPPWLQAEPGDLAPLATALAEDVRAWMMHCDSNG